MIAIFYPQFYGVGGIARYLDSFLSNLPEDHPPIYLITGDEHRDERNYPGVEIVHIPFTSSRWNLLIWGWKARKCIKRLYAEGKIKWVNLHFPPLIPGLFIPRHIPLLITVHSTYRGMSGRFYSKQYYPSEINWLSLRMKLLMESWIYKIADRAITLTEFGLRQVRSYEFSGPIEIIPNGVDLQQFNPSADIQKDIDVLFSGRIERLKGSNGIAEVCRRLVKKKSDISIFIVGYGAEENWLHDQLADMASNITFTGKVPFEEMMRYYNRSHLYASTSYYEGLPGTCLEAMAMQLPAVVWDFLFYRGLVVAGETGLLAAPNDYDGMVDHILKLLDNPELAEQMGRNGRMLLEERYSWKKLAVDVLANFD